MIKKGRKFFTLLEMILVLAILSLVGSVAGYMSFKASKQEEFQAAAVAVAGRLRFAEELMMLGIDLTVRFKMNGRKLEVILEPDRLLNETTLALLSISAPISGITEVYFNKGESIPLEKIRLKYASNGMSMPKGDLVLKSPYGEKHIELMANPLVYQQTQNSDDLYPHEILQKTK